MDIRLLCHLRGDGDLLPAWFQHHRGLGVSSFHVIVHGPREDNRRLYALAREFPVVVEDAYDEPYSSLEKRRRLNVLLKRFTNDWLLWVDSDEFLELPLPDLFETASVLERQGKSVMCAPMLQRFSATGALEDHVMGDPSERYPLCDPELYRRLGVPQAWTIKHPFFRARSFSRLANSHLSPNGPLEVSSNLQGVTHHYKWRPPVLERLRERAQSAISWRGQSRRYLEYLERHGHRLPVATAFPYSRRTLFERGLLRAPDSARERRTGSPSPLKRWLQEALSRLGLQAYRIAPLCKLFRS